MFNDLFVVGMGFEPTRAMQPKGFSYYTCFYTGKLFTPQLEMTYCLCISINIGFTSFCSLDYFFTILKVCTKELGNQIHMESYKK